MKKYKSWRLNTMLLKDFACVNKIQDTLSNDFEDK